MARLIPALDAHQHLEGTMTGCSHAVGWRSILLRSYVDPPVVEELTTPPTADHLIVLTTSGECEIEGRYRGQWHAARYRAGSLGMTAPGQEVTLRWRGSSQHETLQLHLPAQTLRDSAEALSRRGARPSELPHGLFREDPMIRHLMLGLSRAMEAGYADLYAETAANFLAIHLLTQYGCAALPPAIPTDDARLRRVNAFIRDDLAADHSLKELAAVAGLSRFHLVRLFKKTYGETPFRRLTRLRMEEAMRLLTEGRDPIIQVALSCGYENPAHFASAFRQSVGVSPSQFRREVGRRTV